MAQGPALPREEVLEALRKMLRRDRALIESIPVLLESRGRMDERDKQARAQAITAMMRHILRDPEVSALLENVLKANRLGHVESVFEEDRDYRFAQLLGEDFWKEFAARKRHIDEAIVQEVYALRGKMTVLEFLAKKLKALGHSEEFELPDLDLPFPPLPAAQKPQP